jgi:hypothetical protein
VAGFDRQSESNNLLNEFPQVRVDALTITFVFGSQQRNSGLELKGSKNIIKCAEIEALISIFRIYKVHFFGASVFIANHKTH